MTLELRKFTKFVEGEATIIELSGVYKRYHAPMARTILLGKPNQLKIDTMNKTIEALNAGISQIKPGNTADDVAQAFWKILDKYGIEKKSRTGYSIGIGYPPCLLYTSPSPRDLSTSRMPSSA